MRKVIYDAGFLFNTGYLFSFLALFPALHIGALIPFSIMVLNWMLGCAILIKGHPTRKFAALAYNGKFLIAAGLSVLYLCVLTTGFTFLTVFAIVMSLGFGLSNLLKANELDKCGMRFEIKSEYVVALSGLCLCLMAGGGSLILIPLFIYAIYLSKGKGMSLLKDIPLKMTKDNPLALSRFIDYITLVFSAVFGLSLVMLLGSGLQMENFAILANFIHSMGAWKLYKITSDLK